MDNVSIFTALMQGRSISVSFPAPTDLKDFLTQMRLRKHRENIKLEKASQAYGIPVDTLGLIKRTVQCEPGLSDITEWPAEVTIFLGEPKPRRINTKFTIVSISDP